MTAFSDYLEDALLKHTIMGSVGGNTLAAIPIIYVSLHILDPAETGAGELLIANSPGYVRVAVDSTSADQFSITTTTDGKQADNLNDITFPTATGNWEIVILWFGIWDSVLGGSDNFLYGGDLSGGPATITNGDTAKFAGGTAGNGALKVELR